MTDVMESNVNSGAAEEMADDASLTARAPAAAVLPCGARLRAARELKSMSLADVAQRLKYAPRQVQALEEGNFEALPGLTFQRGFVRGYARLVGLDASELVAHLEREIGRDGGPTTTQLQQIAYSPTLMPSRTGRTSAWPWIVGMLLVVTGIGGIALYMWDAPVPERAGAAMRSGEGLVRSEPAPVGSDGATIRTSDGASVRAGDDAARGTSVQEAPTRAPVDTGLPPVTQPNVVPASGADGVGRPIPMPQPLVDIVAPEGGSAKAVVPVSGSTGSTVLAGSGNGKIRLVFSGESWVEVRQGNGALVYSGTNIAGSEQWVDGEPPFDLVVGNSRVVKVTYRGADVNLEPFTKVTVARLQLK